jgi:HD-GYP domain-containing protein (c-di-GMP phosphodiesterase class II)
VALRSDGWSLVLSVVVAAGGAAAPQVLGRLERVAAAGQEASALRHARRGLARRLLEPGEQRYPELVAHSVAVSRLSWLMAQALELDHQGCEQALLAGLLHDVGMRELEYARLYRHRAPSPEDRRIYRQHSLLGERLLRGAGIDQVAVAVRHHHERWDGQGYPDRLSGESIPLLARLVHVAEVFDVLTSASSYRPPLPPEHGLATLTAASGQQFDPGLVQLLARVVR